MTNRKLAMLMTDVPRGNPGPAGPSYSSDPMIRELVKDWIQVGLSTEPCDREKAEYWLAAIYQASGVKPVPVLWMDSPKDTARFFFPEWEGSGCRLNESVGRSVWAKVQATGAREYGEWPSEDLLVLTEACDDEGMGLVKTVLNAVRQSVREAVGVEPSWLYGNQDAVWLFYYSYLRSTGLEPTLFIPYLELARHCGWWAPYDHLVVATEKPTEINFDEQKRIHNLNGPAIAFRDGFGVYQIHGRSCPKWVCDTPPEGISVKEWSLEKNVDTRLAIGHKIGDERIRKEGNVETIDRRIVTIGRDEKHPYAVVSMNVGDGARLMLEMKNPSTGEVHREYVPPDCRTVEKALAFRNGTPELPATLT